MKYQWGQELGWSVDWKKSPVVASGSLTGQRIVLVTVVGRVVSDVEEKIVTSN